MFRSTMARDRELVQDKEYFELRGSCAVCNVDTNMGVSKFLSFDDNGTRMPLWRETIVCPVCDLNNRMRALLHIMKGEPEFSKSSKIYFTEQITKTFQAAKAIWPEAIGSEYLRDGTPVGETNATGVRCEDMTRLSFDPDCFDGFITMDVIEHVPRYVDALREVFRVLRPGGKLLLSAPFNLDIETSQTRATIDDVGGIHHLLEPEYHGDPLDPRGLLCFTTFGWDFLDKLRDIGFVDPAMVFYWSEKFGYLGIQYCITASKGTPSRVGMSTRSSAPKFLDRLNRWIRTRS